MKSTVLFIILFSLSCFAQGKYFTLKKEQVYNGAHHLNHYYLYHQNAPGYNKEILKAIDVVQATAINGGGYFAFGKDSIPPESPIGYEVKLNGKSLITPPRTTSYCSGASYSVLMEAMNLILKNKLDKLSPERLEALRYQEPDGGRREDNIKAWGKWNDDGYGSEYSLVQYLGMGKRIKPSEARPGDFVNVIWKRGGGHSVVFLGWYQDEKKEKYIYYFSSQKITNGMSDQLAPIDNIKEVVFVRLTNPDNIFTFDINKQTERNIPADKLDW